MRDDHLTADGQLDPAKVEGMRLSLGAGGIGTPVAWPVDDLLREVGHDISDVELVQLGGGPDMLVALESGGLAAGWVQSPFWQDPALEACCTLISERPTWAHGIYVMSGSFVDADRDAAKAFLRAIMRTNRTYLQGDYHADPEVVDVLTETFGVTEDVITGTPPFVFDEDLMPYATEDVQAIQEMWLRLGGVLDYDTPIPADELVDLSLVEEILEE